MTAYISVEDQTEAAIQESMETQCIVSMRVPAGSNWYPDADDWDFEDITPADHDGPELFLLVHGNRAGVKFQINVVEFWPLK